MSLTIPRISGIYTFNTASYSIQEIRTWNGLEDLKNEWDSLGDRVDAPNLFSMWKCTSLWFNHFVPNACPMSQNDNSSQLCPLRILVLRDYLGECVGIVPMYTRRGASDLALRCSSATKYATIDHMYSREWRLIGDLGRYGEGMIEEPSILLEAGLEEPLLQCIADYICAYSSDEWDIFKLRVQTTDSNLRLPKLPQVIQSEYRKNDGSQVVKLENDWVTYRRTLSRSMKDNLAYYPRLLNRRGHKWSITCIQNVNEIRENTRLLIDLHRERATFQNGQNHQDHIPTCIHAAFVEDILVELAKAGRVSIWRMDIDGSPAAVQAFLEYKGQIVVYYSGFQERWREYSPLTIIMTHVIENACQRGIKLINFLPGVEPWKSRWGAKTSYYIHDVQGIRRQPSSMARIFVRSVARELTHGSYNRLVPR